MKVREFVESGTALNQYFIYDFETASHVYMSNADKWEVTLSDYAEYEVMRWYALDHARIGIECQPTAPTQTMQEVCAEFMDYVDSCGVGALL